MKFTKILTALCAGILLAMPAVAPTAVYAEDAGNDTVTVTNNANLGNVSIKLTSNHVASDGTRTETPFFMNVLPGAKVPQELSIKNEAEDCWIRARLRFNSNDEKHILTEDDVSIASDDWVRKSDGYYYYTKPVKSGDTVVFVDSVTIPATWEDTSSNTMFRINCRADAVQEVHFTPNFNSEDPWFGTIIEQSVYNYTYDDEGNDKRFAVEYKGGAEGMVKLNDNWFQNWGTLMPGDSFKGEAKISNSYAYPVRMYFSMENSYSSELGDKIRLRLYRGTEKIYDGPLSRSADEIVLAEMGTNSTFVFHYEIDVPAELTDKYALNQAEVKWIFRAEPMVGPTSKNWTNTDAGRGMIGALISMAAAGAALVIVNRWLKERD